MIISLGIGFGRGSYEPPYNEGDEKIWYGGHFDIWLNPVISLVILNDSIQLDIFNKSWIKYMKVRRW